MSAHPLKWRRPTDHPADDPNASWVADGIGGRYSIQEDHGDVLVWWAHDSFLWEACVSVAEAKEKAEADWQKRHADLTVLTSHDALARALEPFAAYARLPGFHRLPDRHVVSVGSSLAGRQLTAGDCKAALAIVDAHAAGRAAT